MLGNRVAAICVGLFILTGLATGAVAADGSTGTCDGNVEVRGKWKVKNRTGQHADDFHFYMYQNDRPHVVVEGAKASSSSFGNVGVTLGTDDGSGSPPPGNHGAQVDMTGGAGVPAGDVLEIDLSLCMNERNNVKIKDIEWTFNGQSPMPGGGGLGFRVWRPFRGGSGGNRSTGGGGSGAQEGNGGNGYWIHVVCIENDSPNPLELNELKLLASNFFYGDLESDIDWASIDPVTNGNGGPPFVIPAGGAWYYYFETTGAYLGGHVYLKYSLSELSGEEFGESGGSGAGGADEDVVFGDHPVEEVPLDSILPGEDAWTTVGQMTYDFGPTPIPQDFFYPGCLPFEGSIFFVSDPINPTDPSDTLVLRGSDPFDRCDIPTPGACTVPIQIVDLSLQSVQPLVVTPNGQPPQLWDVHLTLTEEPSPPGTMQIDKLNPQGGLFTTDLFVQPVFTFTRVDPPHDVLVFDTAGVHPPVQFSMFPGEQVPWTHDMCSSSSSSSQLTFSTTNMAPDGPLNLQQTNPPGGSQWSLAPVRTQGDACLGCTQPEGSSGYAELPARCAYKTDVSPVVITDGLPNGSSLIVSVIVDRFHNIAPTVGGNIDPAGQVLDMDAVARLDIQGTGSLATLRRTVTMPVEMEVHTSPRTPGASSETLTTDMVRLEGALFGDPDFCVLRLSGGSSLGLPSPGHTTLTRLGPPGSDFQVDSFFDIEYRIEFQGCPGSVLDSFGGTTPVQQVRLHQDGDSPPAPSPDNQCVAPDDGTGTVHSPVPCPMYTPVRASMDVVLPTPNASELWMRPQLGLRFDTALAAPGGTLGGGTLTVSGDLRLEVSGTGSVSSLHRTVGLPITAEIHTAPRTPGDAIQDFDTDMFLLQGELFGDPDFDLLRITAGTSLGLPSPGHTTLTRLGPPGSNWQVDSFFDIEYRIEFQGAPGSTLDGLSGTTPPRTLRVSMQKPPTPIHPFGVAHEAVHAAHVDRDQPTGKLKISNLGSSGCDGYSIAGGGSGGGETTLEMEAAGIYSMCMVPHADGDRMCVRSDPLGGGVETLSLDNDCDAGGALTATLSLDDAVVDTFTWTQGTAPQVLVTAHLDSTKPGGNKVRWGDWTVDSFFDIEYAVDPNSSITGRPPVTANRVTITRSGQCVCEPGYDCSAPTNRGIEVLGTSSVVSISELESRLQAFGLMCSSAGGGGLTNGGTLTVSGGTLRVSNLGSSGCDGVSIDLGDSSNNGAVAELEPVIQNSPDMGITITARDQHGNPQGRVSHTRRLSTVSHLDADFSETGATTARLDMYRGGIFVGSSPPFPAVSTIDVTPGPTGLPQVDKCGKLAPFPPFFPCFVMHYDRDGQFTPPGGGPPLLGDEVRVLALDAPTPTSSVSELTIMGERLGSITLTSASSVTQCAPVVVSATSVHLHAGVEHVISLGAGGTPHETECRASSSRTLRVTFDSPIHAADGLPELGDEVLVDFGTGIAHTDGSVTIDQNVMTILLNNLPSSGCASVTVDGLACTNNAGLSDPVTPSSYVFELLVGDATGNSRVTSADVNHCRQEFGPVQAGSHRCDMNLDGVVNETDVNRVKGSTTGRGTVATCP